MERLLARHGIWWWHSLGGVLERVWLRRSVLCVAVCVVIALLYAFPPAATRWYPRCLFHYLTGLNCPGCGSLRALHAILHGRVIEAVGCNPLLVAVLSVSVAGGVLRVIAALALKRSVDVRLPSRVNVAIAVAVVLFFVARNVPAYPFTLLSP